MQNNGKNEEHVNLLASLSLELGNETDCAQAMSSDTERYMLGFALFCFVSECYFLNTGTASFECKTNTKSYSIWSKFYFYTLKCCQNTSRVLKKDVNPILPRLFLSF